MVLLLETMRDSTTFPCCLVYILTNISEYLEIKTTLGFSIIFVESKNFGCVHEYAFDRPWSFSNLNIVTN